MKFSRKMILVPACGRDEPENEKMSELDDEMSIIVNNRKLSVKEKVEMYNDVLLHKQEGFETRNGTRKDGRSIGFFFAI